MPLSADRCQVTWGPNPLKRAEVGSGGNKRSGCTFAERVCACTSTRGVTLKCILGDLIPSGQKILVKDNIPTHGPTLAITRG